MSQKSITQVLADFAAQTRPEEIPRNAIHASRRAMLDFCGVAIAGIRHPATLALSDILKFSSQGTSLIVGTDESTSALAAAQINGFAAHVNDWDDTILPARAHFGATLFPAILAESAVHDWSLGDALAALAIGFEISARLSAAAYPAVHENKWHTTSVIGPVGVAAALSRLLGANVEQTVNAIGLATNGAGGLMSGFGTPAKALNVGRASSWGLMSAKLGFSFETHPDSVGNGGFMQCFANDDKLRQCTNDLGMTWAIEQNGFKPYPCGFVAHASIDALRDLSAIAEGREPLGITLEVAPVALELMGRQEPKNELEAKFSLSHTAACAWVFGNVSTEAFSDKTIADPQVRSIARKISVLPTASIPQDSARAKVTYSDGSHHEMVIPAARGSSKRPMSDDDLVEKFLSAAKGSGLREPRALADWILTSSEDFPLSSLIDFLRGEVDRKPWAPAR